MFTKTPTTPLFEGDSFELSVKSIMTSHQLLQTSFDHLQYVEWPQRFEHLSKREAEGKKITIEKKQKENKKRDKSKTNYGIRRVNVVLRQTFTTQL